MNTENQTKKRRTRKDIYKKIIKVATTAGGVIGTIIELIKLWKRK